ncbi:MAG TPA: NADH-quinone oxidoreductase subunit J [Jiangellaceae bacterium]|nr:NADH-quinone oxidoreductase subunit J [Jiangellaceae bacterium]
MNLVELAFVLLGALALGAGALAVTTARVVHAALWLAASLAAVAGCFLLLAAELLVWIQVLIYVGAVVVLVLFALMLTRAPTGPVPGAPRARLIVAGVVAAATAAVLLGTLLGTLGGERIDLDSTRVGTASEMGGALFSGWVLPFEALSVLLLAALIGAIALTRRLTAPAPSRRRSEEQPADAAGSTAGHEEGSGR